MTTLDFEEQVLKATEEYNVQKAARDEAKAAAMKARDDERLAKQIAAARKIAPGFLDTDQRILTPTRVDSPSLAKDASKDEGANTLTTASTIATVMQPTTSNSKVNYDEFESGMAPPDPWEAPQSLSDMLSSLDGNRSSSSPVIAANSQFHASSPRVSIDATRHSQDIGRPATYVQRAQSSSPPIPRAEISTSDLASTLASRLLLHNNIPQQAQPPPPPPPPSLPPKLENGKGPEPSTSRMHPPAINPSMPSAGPSSTASTSPSSQIPAFPSSPSIPSSTFAPVGDQKLPLPVSSSELNESAIAQLVDIGFERSLAIKALEKKNGKVDAAIEWLLDGNS